MKKKEISRLLRLLHSSAVMLVNSAVLRYCGYRDSPNHHIYFKICYISLYGIFNSHLNGGPSVSKIVQKHRGTRFSH